jgi:hypothetical protein
MSSPYSLHLLLQEGSSIVELRQSAYLYVAHLNSTLKYMCFQIALIPLKKVISDFMRIDLSFCS